MRIYSMTATFGKLEHETLTLKPGLNIIQAPNEWGKSTWCAFLLAMLYGIETRVHSTKAVLADKERYAPWSGSPMSGRMDICWQGKNITIERRSKGRSVLSEFSAYETDSGMPVAELTAGNCGQVLLGIERSVFVRAGFLRLADLPVTQDEALRRRLNALVTTGDESGAADDFEQTLKDLKNRCKFNRTGLLPQAQAQRDALMQKLQHIHSLESQAQSLQENIQQNETDINNLKNHQLWLDFEEAKQNQDKLNQARTAMEEAKHRHQTAQAAVAGLPTKEEAAASIQNLQQLQNRAAVIQAAAAAQNCFGNISAQEAEATVRKDIAALTASNKPFLWILSVILAVLALSIGYIALITSPYLLMVALCLLIGACVTLFVGIQRKNACHAALSAKYGGLQTAQWLHQAHQYAHAQESLLSVETELLNLTAGRTPEEAFAYWQNSISAQQTLEDTHNAYNRATEYFHLLSSVVKPEIIPNQPDQLNYSPEKTTALLEEAAYTQKQLQLQYGQCRGQIQQLGSVTQLQSQLTAVNQRIDQLEQTLSALTIAQQTLAEARTQLQRRFAPKITQRAQSLFGQLTGQRYNRLSLGDDFAVQAGAQNEDTLRSSLWRSEGTVDQLYLALRLAVAGELAPQAPLVLDDALVRFDDTRLAAAMALLQQESQNKQILLFTCQSRESAYL